MDMRRHRREASSSSGTPASASHPAKPIDTSSGGPSNQDPSEKGVKVEPERRHRRDASSSGTPAPVSNPAKPIDTSSGTSTNDPSEKGVKNVRV